MPTFNPCSAFSGGVDSPNPIFQSHHLTVENCTHGAKTLMRSTGQWYHEVILGEDFGGWATPRIGWATDLFIEGCSCKGVGCCNESWGVCGVEHKIWHLAVEPFQWPRQWQAGDIIGLAIDIDKGTIKFSFNGIWILNDSYLSKFLAMGRSFFPALTIVGSFTMALTQASWYYSPPSDTYLAWSGSGRFEYKIRSGMFGTFWGVPAHWCGFQWSDATVSFIPVPLQLIKVLYCMKSYTRSNGHVIIDDHEVEIVNAFNWRCQCGHRYNPFLDDVRERDFRDLPAEWPCPDCGQRVARNWHAVQRLSHPWSDLGYDSRPLSARWDSRTITPRVFVTGLPHMLLDVTPREFITPIVSSTCTPRSHDDLEAFSDAESFSALSLGHEEQVTELGAFHILPMRNWQCNDCDENLEWADDFLWCEACSVRVHWPVRQTENISGHTPIFRQQSDGQPSFCHPCSVHDSELADDFFFTSSTLESPRQIATSLTSSKQSVQHPELRNDKWVFGAIADQCGSGRLMHRNGLGREFSPTRPGHRAGGGHSGPWWTVPEACYLTI
eukprot:gnl/MRDRNA2_/MRDRNA2_101992_c0_seq1.p1 gnl/MRDRNA2_/MRDRNA2_101992_c0~~gnl/MRDRNA2_/MRDRNA2_101992_c0_seq1.p1  ORF type:complete len:553 (+),score=49.23 gnl/MRDRNA2_/MRDRNA2_101992_c0_seq1:87-1745(+)